MDVDELAGRELNTGLWQPHQNNFGAVQSTANNTSHFVQQTTSAFGSTPMGGLQQRTSQLGQPIAGANTLSCDTFATFNSLSKTHIFAGTTVGTANVKFHPVMGRGSPIFKDGRLLKTPLTKHQCIIAMQEYLNKSFEELRFEDYTSNRKGPQLSGSTSLATTNTTTALKPSALTPSTGFVVQPQVPSTSFSQQQNLSQRFGDNPLVPSTSFSQLQNLPTRFGANIQVPSTSFSQPQNLPQRFGANPQVSSTSFSQPQNLPTGFGANPQFPSTSFSQPQNLSTGFVANPQVQFASSSQQQNLFTGFVATTSGASSTAATSFGSMGGTGLFNQKPNIGVCYETQFSANQTNLFGSKPFGTELCQQASTAQQNFSSLLSNTSNKYEFNNTLGTQLSTLAGGTTLESAFSGGELSAPKQQASIAELLQLNATTPHGDNPIFRNMRNSDVEEKKSNLLQSSSNQNLTARLGMHFRRAVNNKKPFEGLDDLLSSPENFQLKYSPKRLYLPMTDASISKESDGNDSEFPLYKRNLNTVIETDHGLNSTISEQVSGKPNETHRPLTPVLETSFGNESSKRKVKDTQACGENAMGITFNQSGYYTIPSKEELQSYTAADGSCIVPNLTIGHKEHGNVYFEQELDVSRYNLDNLVKFQHKEVNINPNCNEILPAQVTLNKIWPRDKTNGLCIKDPQRLVEMDWEGKLRSVCAQKGARFIEYRPGTGSWVFHVDAKKEQSEQ